MSYICCEGIYTVECAGCDRQLCPTSGHREITDYNKNDEPLCYSCAVPKKCKPPNFKEIKAAKLALKADQRLISLKDRYEKEVQALKIEIIKITRERDELLMLVNSK